MQGMNIQTSDFYVPLAKLMFGFSLKFLNHCKIIGFLYCMIGRAEFLYVIYIMNFFLTATKQLYEWFSPSAPLGDDLL